MAARRRLGRGYHNAARARRHHSPFGHRAQHRRVCRLGRVRPRATRLVAKNAYGLTRCCEIQGFIRFLSRTKQREIYVISTLNRPVPLEYNLYVNKELYKIVNARREFLNDGYPCRSLAYAAVLHLAQTTFVSARRGFKGFAATPRRCWRKLAPRRSRHPVQQRCGLPDAAVATPRARRECNDPPSSRSVSLPVRQRKWVYARRSWLRAAPSGYSMDLVVTRNEPIWSAWLTF